MSTPDDMRAWFAENSGDVEGWLVERPWLVRRAAELAESSEANAASLIRTGFEAEMGPRPSAPQEPLVSIHTRTAVEEARERYEQDPTQRNALAYGHARLRGVIPDSHYQQG